MFYKHFCLLLVGLILTLTIGTGSLNAGLLTTPCCSENQTNYEKLRCDLAQAQREKDIAKVEKLSASLISVLGSQAGVADPPDKFYLVAPTDPKLTVALVQTAFAPYLEKIEAEAWWLKRPQPEELEDSLRFPASVILGSLAAKRAGAKSPTKLLSVAEGAADYLLWAQTQGERGLFPFPNSQQNGQQVQIVEKLLAQAQERGKLNDVLVNGWIVNDLGDGGLQYDNGLCGVALLELYETTGKLKYLEGALAAADWAVLQPVVPNWNYNSFSVFLLAEVYRVTGETHYLKAAKEKARLGIYPGQLQTGFYQGRWFDPHNARLVYHYIIIRSLGALVAVLPEDDPELSKALETLSKALQEGNEEIIAHQGVTNPGTLLDVLCRLELNLSETSLSHLHNSYHTQALDIVGRYTSTEFLRGKLPVEPSAWGLFLETLTQNHR